MVWFMAENSHNVVVEFRFGTAAKVLEYVVAHEVLKVNGEGGIKKVAKIGYLKQEKNILRDDTEDKMLVFKCEGLDMNLPVGYIENVLECSLDSSKIMRGEHIIIDSVIVSDVGWPDITSVVPVEDHKTNGSNAEAGNLAVLEDTSSCDRNFEFGFVMELSPFPYPTNSDGYWGCTLEEDKMNNRHSRIIKKNHKCNLRNLNSESPTSSENQQQMTLSFYTISWPQSYKQSNDILHNVQSPSIVFLRTSTLLRLGSLCRSSSLVRNLFGVLSCVELEERHGWQMGRSSRVYKVPWFGDGRSALDSRVQGLEMALDEISPDLAISSGRMSSSKKCCKLPDAEFLNPKIWRRSEDKYLNASMNSPESIRSPAFSNISFKEERAGIQDLNHVRGFTPHVTNKLGMKHVKGLLLCGPPGTGKTLMAAQIGKMLTVRELQKLIGAAFTDNDIVVVATVLSGNRNFERFLHPQVQHIRKSGAPFPLAFSEFSWIIVPKHQAVGFGKLYVGNWFNKVLISTEMTSERRMEGSCYQQFLAMVLKENCWFSRPRPPEFKLLFPKPCGQGFRGGEDLLQQKSLGRRISV